MDWSASSQGFVALREFKSGFDRLGVKTGNAQNKQMLSALPPLATGERTFRIGSFVPTAVIAAVRRTEFMECRRDSGRTYSALMLAARITLAHFSVSAAI